VVLHHDGQPLVRRVQGRPLGHGPGLEDAVHLQAEVVVEAARGVLLDDEGEGAFVGLLTLRLRFRRA
jgi:hypothetical protein